MRCVAKGVLGGTLLLLAATMPVPAQDAGALAVMKQYGLTRQGDYWMLEKEKQLLEEKKRYDEVLDQVLPLKDRFRSAIEKNGQRLRTRLVSLESELQKVEKELEVQGLPRRTRARLRAKRRQLRDQIASLERTTWWWERTRLRGAAALNEIAKKYALERQKAAIYLRRIWRLGQELRSEYTTLGQRADVRDALAKLGGKLGPLTDHVAEFKRQKPRVAEILDGPMPLFFEKGYFWSYIAVNEKPVLVRITEQPTSWAVLLTRQTALEVGLRWDETKGPSTISGKDDRNRSFSYRVFKSEPVTIMAGGISIPKTQCYVMESDSAKAVNVFSLYWLSREKKFGVHFFKDMLIVGIGFRPEKFGYQFYSRQSTPGASTSGASEPEIYVPF